MGYDPGKTPNENFETWRDEEPRSPDPNINLSQPFSKFQTFTPESVPFDDAMTYGFGASRGGERIDPREFHGYGYSPFIEANAAADWIKRRGFVLFENMETGGIDVHQHGKPFMSISIDEMQSCQSREAAVLRIKRLIETENFNRIAAMQTQFRSKQAIFEEFMRKAFQDYDRPRGFYSDPAGRPTQGFHHTEPQRHRVPADAMAKMRKVKAMLSSSFEGERENARAMLDALLAKHGLRECDIG